MNYPHIAIPESMIPSAADPIFQHMVDTYASETNKVIAVWSEFDDSTLAFRPHPKSSTVEEIIKHQLLSERRFFAEFLSSPEPEATSILPAEPNGAAYRRRMLELAEPRLSFLASRTQGWWLETVPFFDVHKQRIWIFWRRVLHTAHHRTQLTVCLRMIGKTVPSTYGPTADVTWTGADPTLTADAAGRR